MYGNFPELQAVRQNCGDFIQREFLSAYDFDGLVRSRRIRK